MSCLTLTIPRSVRSGGGRSSCPHGDAIGLCSRLGGVGNILLSSSGLRMPMFGPCPDSRLLSSWWPTDLLEPGGVCTCIWKWRKFIVYLITRSKTFECYAEHMKSAREKRWLSSDAKCSGIGFFNIKDECILSYNYTNNSFTLRMHVNRIDTSQ